MHRLSDSQRVKSTHYHRVSLLVGWLQGICRAAGVACSNNATGMSAAQQQCRAVVVQRGADQRLPADHAAFSRGVRGRVCQCSGWGRHIFREAPGTAGIRRAADTRQGFERCRVPVVTKCHLCCRCLPSSLLTYAVCSLITSRIPECKKMCNDPNQQIKKSSAVSRH